MSMKEEYGKAKIIDRLHLYTSSRSINRTFHDSHFNPNLCISTANWNK
jgi:hypothetical protein